MQARWTVDGEHHSYDPIFCEGREAADEAAKQTAATLRHFPTLEVVVSQATAEEVETVPSVDRSPAADDAVRLLDQVSGTAACGPAGNMIALELWNLSTGTSARLAMRLWRPD